MRALLSHVLNLNEKEDRGIGLTPLLKEFIYDKMVNPENVKNIEKKITGYYQAILKSSGSIYVAYNRTRKWALTIFK